MGFTVLVWDRVFSSCNVVESLRCIGNQNTTVCCLVALANTHFTNMYIQISRQLVDSVDSAKERGQDETG